jgi:methylated-DNA-[protein]-cysteine S-methyltransferase
MNHHYIFSTPLGNAAFIYRNYPLMLIRSFLPCQDADERFRTAGSVEWGQPDSDNEITAIAQMMTDYFHGGKIIIPWDVMDFGNITDFRETVLKTAAAIPYGEVRTYRELAEAVGHPKASRAVGSALANNPFPILIPCHRVIRSDGTVGQFGGGTDMKTRLIELELRHRT